MGAKDPASESEGPTRQPLLKGTLRDALAAATASLTSPSTPRTREPALTDEKVKPAPIGAATTSAPELSAPLVTEPARAAVPAAAAPAVDLPPLPPARDPNPTRIVRPSRAPRPDASPLTRRVRAKPSTEALAFHQDPVVGWLVVVGGPGLGAFRPIFEGNNAVGRAPTQRIPLDFGDDGISAEAQAYIRYDAADRAFLLVPNMAKTNIVAVNEKKPTSAVPLAAMDLITMGRTQLCFIPFCGPEFDWAELGDGPA